MNIVLLIGRLTKDPDVRYAAGNGMAVAAFNLAVDRPVVKEGSEKAADFPRIKVFGKQAESCEKYLKKGSKVAVQGRIRTDSYQNKNGDMVYTTEVAADRVEFLETARQKVTLQQHEDPHDDFEEIEDDEGLPF